MRKKPSYFRSAALWCNLENVIIFLQNQIRSERFELVFAKVNLLLVSGDNKMYLKLPTQPSQPRVSILCQKIFLASPDESRYQWLVNIKTLIQSRRNKHKIFSVQIFSSSQLFMDYSQTYEIEFLQISLHEEFCGKLRNCAWNRRDTTGFICISALQFISRVKRSSLLWDFIFHSFYDQSPDEWDAEPIDFNSGKHGPQLSYHFLSDTTLMAREYFRWGRSQIIRGGAGESDVSEDSRRTEVTRAKCSPSEK